MHQHTDAISDGPLGHPWAGGLVVDGYLGETRTPQQVTQLRLVEVRLRQQRVGQESPDDHPVETLVAGGGVVHTRAKQHIAEYGPNFGKDRSSQVRFRDRSPIDEATPEGAFVPLVQDAQEHRYGPRVVRQAGVHLDDDGVTVPIRFTVAPEVGVHHVPVLGCPDGLESLVLRSELLAQLQGPVLRDLVHHEVDSS